MAGSPFDLSHNPTPPNGATVATYRPLYPSFRRFGYTATIPGDRIYGATLDANTGTLTEIAGMPTKFNGGLGAGVGLLIYNASGSRLYAPHVQGATPATPGEISVFQVNAPSGTLTPLGTYRTGGLTPTVPAHQLRRQGAGRRERLFRHRRELPRGRDGGHADRRRAGSPFSTGAPTTNVVTNVAWHASKPFVYATNTVDDPGSVVDRHLHRRPRPRAVLTPIGTPTTTGGTGAAIGAVDRSGRFFYVSNRGSNSIAAFTIDQTTGALTAVAGSPFATQAQPSGIAFDPSGKYLYVPNNGAATVTAYAINATTGALTVVNTDRDGNRTELRAQLRTAVARRRTR